MNIKINLSWFEHLGGKVFYLKSFLRIMLSIKPFKQASKFIQNWTFTLNYILIFYLQATPHVAHTKLQNFYVHDNSTQSFKF